MSERLKYVQFQFCGDADGSPLDHYCFIESRPGNVVAIGARYKNCEPNHLYELLLDPGDLRAFGRQCLILADLLEEA